VQPLSYPLHLPAGSAALAETVAPFCRSALPGRGPPSPSAGARARDTCGCRRHPLHPRRPTPSPLRPLGLVLTAGPYAEVLDRGSLVAMAGFRFRPGRARPRPLGVTGSSFRTLSARDRVGGTEIDRISLLPISSTARGACFAGQRPPQEPGRPGAPRRRIRIELFFDMKTCILGALRLFRLRHSPTRVPRHSDCPRGTSAPRRGHGRAGARCRPSIDAGQRGYRPVTTEEDPGQIDNLPPCRSWR